MADPEDLTGDVVDPASMDWAHEDDLTVWQAAQAGIRQAVDEAARRNSRPQAIHQQVAAHRARRR